MAMRVQGGVRQSPPAAETGPSTPGEHRAPPRAGPLRVVLISTQRKWYGGEEQARLLAAGLRDQGHRCTILARRDGAFAGRMAAEGFPVATFAGNGRNAPALWAIRRRLRRIRPHVLHYNDPHAVSSGGLASLGLGIPARVASRRAGFSIRFAARYRLLCDRVVCVSHDVARVCRESGLPSQLLRVVHDGVEPARVRSGSRQRGRRSLGLADDQPLLLTVARLTRAKGHEFLLSALPEVIESRPGACVALVGDGELTRTLTAQARRLGVDSRVRFLGYRDDVPDLIQAADLFVFPSHTEGLGSTLIDVMLAGRAIVTTTGGGIPDLTGSDDPHAEPVAWTVPPRDARALARAILEALHYPHERAAREARALARAERLFTAERMVDSTLALYREVLRL